MIVVVNCGDCKWLSVMITIEIVVIDMTCGWDFNCNNYHFDLAQTNKS